VTIFGPSANLKESVVRRVFRRQTRDYPAVFANKPLFRGRCKPAGGIYMLLCSSDRTRKERISHD